MKERTQRKISELISAGNVLAMAFTLFSSFKCCYGSDTARTPPLLVAIGTSFSFQSKMVFIERNGDPGKQVKNIRSAPVFTGDVLFPFNIAPDGRRAYLYPNFQFSERHALLF